MGVTKILVPTVGAGHAAVAEEQLGLRAIVFASDDTRYVADLVAGPTAQAESLGRRHAERLLAAGKFDFVLWRGEVR